MADDYFNFDEDEVAPRRRDNLFVWTIFILLLIGLAFACWLGSFYIFGHPEQARSYRILKKLKKIEAPRRFEEIAAPPGEFLSAQRLFERFSKFTRLELERENAELLRNFVNNYRETKKLVPYVRGNFTIMSASELAGQDFLSSGMVALGVSNDFPQVLIEHLYPMTPENTAKARKLLVMGNPIKLEKTYDLGAVIHAEKISDGRMKFTIVPLLYGSYALNGGVGTFSTEPPPDLNMERGLPVVSEARIAEAVKAFAAFRRTQPVAEAPGPGEAPVVPKGPEIVRLDAVPDGAKVPETGALPEMPVATPIPVAASATPRKATPGPVAMLTTPVPREMPVATPLPMDRRGPPTPVPTPPMGAATPLSAATPSPNVPAGVIKPFIASNPQPGLPGAQGNLWRTYKPGAVPAGRSIAASEAAALAERGAIGERTYLRGNFVVTASGENRAVLRPKPGSEGAGSAPVRIIVEYANGAVAPAEGSALNRDESRPYEIRDVRRDAGGELNIWVREIIQQQ